jgi:hypothetical protein
VKNEHGTEYKAWALNGLEEPLKKYTNKDETASRISCDCDVLPCLTFRDVGHRFMDSGCYQMV